MSNSPHSQLPVDTKTSPASKGKIISESMRKYRLLYIIGDSISLGYMEPLWYEQFSGKTGEGIYTIAHSPGCGTSAVVRMYLDDWLTGYCPDVVLFNSGLHDIGRWPKDMNVPLQQYEANLREIVTRLRQIPGPPILVWARNTPVIDDRHNTIQPFVRYNSDIVTYNEAADAIMAEAGVVSVDLYSAVMANNPENIITKDGV